MSIFAIHKKPIITFLAIWILAALVATNLGTPQVHAVDRYAVTNVVATPGNQSITVAWDPPPPHADGYRHTGNSFGIRIGTESRDRDEKWTFGDGRTYTYTQYDHKSATFQCDGQPHTGVQPLCNGVTYQLKIWSHFSGDDGDGGEVDDTGWFDVTVGGDQPVVRVNTTTPLAAPGAPTNIVVSPGINELAVDWDPPTPGTNNAPTNYVIQWNLGSVTQQDDTGTGTDYTIGDLIPGRQYRVRVRAENSAGGTWSQYVNGAPLTVTKVETIAVTNSTATGIVTITNPESASQIINLRYRKSSSTDQWRTAASLSTNGTTATFQLPSSSDPSNDPAPNLEANATYEVQASLDPRFQTGVRSHTFTMFGPPDNLRVAVSPSDQTLHVTWSVDLNGGTILSQVGQSVRWESTNPATTGTQTIGDVDQRSHTIENLTNGTAYTVTVTVITNYGTAQSSGITRSPASGPSVDDITFPNPGGTSATAVVSVINTHLATDTITAHLRYREKPGAGADPPAWNTPAPQTVSGTTASFSLIGLMGATEYEVEASLTNDFGDSVIRVLTTADSAPGTPKSVSSDHGDSELTLKWSEPHTGGQDILEYIIYWKPDGEGYSASRRKVIDATVYSPGGDGLFAEPITGLVNGTEYTVKISAKNSIGEGPAVEVTGTPSTIPGWPPLNLTASACDEVLHLSWMPSKDTGGSPILAFVIQWKSGTEEYDATTRQSVQETADPFFSLEDLVTGTEYTMRVAAANMNNYDAMDDLIVDSLSWSDELTATPQTGPCLLELRFGNPLAKSVPAYVTVQDATSATSVYLRYRPAVSSAWIATLTGATTAENNTVTFDITGLMPSTMYEVEASLDSGFSRNGSTIRAFFTTGEMSENWHSGGSSSGGSIARILRIEAGVGTITLAPDSQVVLWVDVYGRQDILDNGLADRAPSAGRPTFEWDVNGRGSFDESDIKSEWQNSQADDREVIFNAPGVPGTYLIEVELPSASDCLAQQSDETAAEAEARCTADFIVKVRQRSVVTDDSEPPVNPEGTIPDTINDVNSDVYDVFTPEDGGATKTNGASVVAGPGAVPNGEAVGLRITPVGPASNVGKTRQRFTLTGTEYQVTAVDSSGVALQSYRFREPATVCIPLPDSLRGDLSDVSLIAIDDAGELTRLSTDIRIGRDGVVVCGGISAFPAAAAVGVKGAPPDEATLEEIMPDTGGFAPPRMILTIAMMLGLATTFVGVGFGRRARKRKVTIPPHPNPLPRGERGFMDVR